MGAETFMNEVSARSPKNGQLVSAQEAFDIAVEAAKYDYGHAGYTGTIAEKQSFIMIDMNPASEYAPEKYARLLINDGDERINDKWGPAGCIRLPDGYLFFGLASS